MLVQWLLLLQLLYQVCIICEQLASFFSPNDDGSGVVVVMEVVVGVRIYIFCCLFVLFSSSHDTFSNHHLTLKITLAFSTPHATTEVFFLHPKRTPHLSPHSHHHLPQLMQPPSPKSLSLSLYLSIYLSIYLSLSLSVSLCHSLSITISVSFCHYVCLSIYLSFSVSVILCLSLYTSLSL